MTNGDPTGPTYISISRRQPPHAIGWFFLTALLFLFILSGCTRIPTTPNDKDLPVTKPAINPAIKIDAAWPHDESDLDPDPTIRFGRLSNGFRYIFKENNTPSDRVSMHLYVQVGSLMETDRQQGMAHFLEHMQFDGSTRFAPDELVMYFQRIGMQFGPDANAHTGFSNTVYDILLPRGDNDSLAEAMLVLHEYAQGALLLPQQIEKEKKVVLAEMRSRDSAAYRALKAELAFELPGTLPPDRLPIGEAETIRSFDQSMLREFYDAWYRPENMVLVVVGHFDPAAALDLAEKQFAGLQARAADLDPPDLGTFRHQGIKAFYFPDTAIGNATVRIETVAAQVQPTDSRKEQHNNLLEELAEQMVSNRLSKMLRESDSPATAADIGSGYFLKRFRFSSISAESESSKWMQSLQAIEQMLRRTLDYGFTAVELERAQKAYQAQLQQAVEAENTRDSKDLAMALMNHLSAERVIRSAVQEKQLLSPMLDAISVEDVNESFRKSWAADHRLILLTGDADLSGTQGSPEEAIMRLYDQSAAMPVQPLVDAAGLPFPYLPEPAVAGAIERQTIIEDLDIEQVWFKNGLYLALKKTPFKDGEVLVSLSFGLGKASEPVDQPGLALLTEALLNEAGFGSMDRETLNEALAGRLAQYRIDIRDDLFQVNGQTSKEDIPVLFQLLHTFIVDPGFRPEPLELVQRRLEQQYVSATHEAQGVMGIEGERFLAGGDSRFGMATPEQLRRLTLEDSKAWFDSQLKTAPLEIAVVGDIDSAQIKSLAAKWLGSLPDRQKVPDALNSDSGPAFPAGQAIVLPTDSKIQNALVVVAYPTEDMWQIKRTRRLGLLSDVFSERLRVRIREKLGAAYSPFAFNHPYRAYEGYGLFQAYLQVDPDQADAVITEVQRIAAELQQEVIGTDEFQRALDPALTRIKDLRQSNGYWLQSVLNASARYPRQLQWARTIVQDYASITAEDIRTMAEQYLDNEKAAVVVVKPMD